MEIKTLPARTILYSRRTTTLKDLAAFAGTAVRELYPDLASGKLLVTGPQYWIYLGADGKPHTTFTLDIAIPVTGDTSGCANSVRELPAFRCVTYQLKGPWEKIAGAYDEIFGYIYGNKLEYSGETRELYHQIDFEHPENNEVEIQVGIK